MKNNCIPKGLVPLEKRFDNLGESSNISFPDQRIKRADNIYKDLKLNYALAQGILYLEKSYCQLNNCGNCPLFMHC